jgi:nicotinic acid mononucleotide adenylyltransferase
MREATADASGAPTIFLVNAPTAPVSSTDVRHRVAAGLSIAASVPAAVARHIEKHGLYQS